jgi:hypothetical protein
MLSSEVSLKLEGVMKTFLIFPMILLVSLFYSSSCNYRKDDPIVKWKGPNDKVELVFFYKKSASYEEKQFFENNILHKPHPQGKGYDLQEGVSGEFFVRNSGYEGHAIEFYLNATPEQRERLKTAIESSPIVYRVYENVVPNQIQDL